MFIWLRRLRARLRHRHFDRDVDREMETHRAMRQTDLELAGVPPEEARFRARRDLGNITLLREDARAVWIARWLDDVRQDVRYAATSLRRKPAFSLGTILILGLGLGLVTTVFTFANATFFRPWQVPNPDTLFFVRSQATQGTDFGAVSMPEYRYLREHSRTFRQMAVTVRSGSRQVFYDNEGFEDVGAMYVSANYFDALGLPLAAGRSFLPDEDNFATPARVVIISERLWRERFNRDPAIVGKTIRLNRGRLHTVVGVAPAGFLDGHSSRIEVWLPLTLALGGSPEELHEYENPKHRDFPHALVGRLRQGVMPTQARAELTYLSAQFRSEAHLPAVSFRLLDTRPTSGGNAGSEQQLVGLVFVALLLVQLVACANVGNLLLARAITRQREIALRLSLGAGRWRIVRQLVTEAVVLSVCGAGLGIGVAAAIPKIALMFVSHWFETPAFYAPDSATFAFAFALSLVTAVACGLAPALRATRVSLSPLTSERHGQTVTTARLRRALLATQIALATVLLVGAGLLTRAIGHAAALDPGFSIADFQQVTVQFPPGSQGPRRSALYQQLFDVTRTEGWPPVVFSDFAPLDSSRYVLPIRTSASAPVQLPFSRGVSENYFEVLGIRLLAGRAPRANDEGHELVLSRAVAESLWPGENPIGKTLLSGFRSDQLKPQIVVGVAPDLPVISLTGTDPVTYTSSQQFAAVLLVRSQNPRVVTRLREAVTHIDPEVTISARPLTDNVADSLFQAVIGSYVAWAIGGVGLVLATIGAFGVFAYSVEERRREIGIRMALGAQAAQVVRLVLSTTQRSVVIGLGAGVVLSASGAPLLRRYLYGLSPFDPLAYLQIAGLLITSAIVATWIPARRATRVNPAVTLRAE